MFVLWGATLLLTLVGGCSSSRVICDPLPASSAPACDEVREANTIASVVAEGSSVGVRVRVESASGAPVDQDLASCLQLTAGQTCSALSTTPTPHPADAGQFAVLLRPGATADDNEPVLLALQTLLENLPDGRVATYRWGSQVRQLHTLTRDRTQLLQMTSDRFGTVSDPVPVNAALAQLADEVSNAARGSFLGPRFLLVVAPDLSVADVRVPSELRSVRLQWLLASAQGSGLPAHHVVLTGDDVEAATQTTVARIQEVMDAGLVELKACTHAPDQVLLQRAGETSVDGLLDADVVAMPAAADCDPATVDPFTTPNADRIEITFTNKQRSKYQTLLASRDRDDFALSVQLGSRATPLAAMAHFRGKSSLDCERPNFSVNIDGGTRHHVLNGSAGDEFYLISMCLDDRYINQHTADTLMHNIGLFPMRFGLLPLIVDGENLGVYLFIEKPHEQARAELSRVRSVVRRELDTDGKPAEVKYASGSEQAALDRYNAWVAETMATNPLDLDAFLRANLDLDQYLRWIALMTILGNGDYVDEVYFVGTETSDAAGEPREFYSMIGWDPDDLFSACHHQSRFAIDDPNELLFCTEALIDHAMFAVPDVYAAYVDILDTMVESQITPDVFNAALDHTLDQLLPHFADPAVRLAMVELLEENPNATDEAEALRDIRAAADQMRADFMAQRLRLQQAIAAYRGANP